MNYKEYITEYQIKDRTIEKEKKELMMSIIKTKIELENSRKNYEFAEGELIDYYLYHIKANQSKLDYLIKKAKKKGMMLDIAGNIQYDVI